MKTSLLIALTLLLSACGPVEHRERIVANSNTVEVEAGSVRNNAEANSICPSVCGSRGWVGTWRNVGDGYHAVCGCAATQTPAATAIVPVQPAGSSCSAQGNQACAGCAVSCPADQQAFCTEGEVRPARDGSVMCVASSHCACR